MICERQSHFLFKQNKLFYDIRPRNRHSMSAPSHVRPKIITMKKKEIKSIVDFAIDTLDTMITCVVLDSGRPHIHLNRAKNISLCIGNQSKICYTFEWKIVSRRFSAVDGKRQAKKKETYAKSICWSNVVINCFIQLFRVALMCFGRAIILINM